MPANWASQTTLAEGMLTPAMRAAIVGDANYRRRGSFIIAAVCALLGWIVPSLFGVHSAAATASAAAISLLIAALFVTAGSLRRTR